MSHRTAGIRTFDIRTLVSFALLTSSHCWHSHCWLRTGVVRTSVFRTSSCRTSCRSMTRGAAQHRSHHVASVRSDRAVLYLLRKTARLRCSSLAFASKIGSFQCFRPKRTVENFSPNKWVLLSFIFFLFLHFFRCFSGENGSFVLQIVQFPRTWCSNHFVSYFEIQILHVSKFFNDFRGNRNLQKMRKKEKEERKEAQTKQRTKSEKPMRSSFLHASAILFSSVLVHLCVVNSTVNEWSDSLVVCATSCEVTQTGKFCKHTRMLCEHFFA